MREAKRDIFCGLCFAVLGAAMFIGGLGIKSFVTETLGPKFMPIVVSAMIFILGVILALDGYKEVKLLKLDGKVDDASGGNLNKSLIATAALLLLYVASLNILGFVAATAIYIFAQILLLAPSDKLDKKNIVMYLIIALAAAPAIHYIFYRAFSIFLPAGILF
jgi:uncharacterized membrane protein